MLAFRRQAQPARCFHAQSRSVALDSHVKVSDPAASKTVALDVVVEQRNGAGRRSGRCRADRILSAPSK